jgi:hypothetical protein
MSMYNQIQAEHCLSICRYVPELLIKIKKKNENSLALVRDNYIDRATSACWRSQCQLVRIEGVAWSSQRIPMVVNLGFPDRENC